MVCTTHIYRLPVCVSKSQTSSEAVRVWNRRSVVWTGPQRCGALASTEHLSVRRGRGGVWLVHLPEVWRSEASRAGRIGCCRWSKPSAGFPETWCSLLELKDHRLHCHFHSLVPRTTGSSLPPGPRVYAPVPPRRSAARTGSCLGGGKVDAAPPPGHVTRGCQVCRVFCWNHRSWTQMKSYYYYSLFFTLKTDLLHTIAKQVYNNYLCIWKSSYPSSDWVSSSRLLVRLSISLPSPPYMLDLGVLRQLDLLEVIQDVWLDPGMFSGEGPMERCRTDVLTLRTVWNTRFGCNLDK